jgi:hypothetical protein
MKKQLSLFTVLLTSIFADVQQFSSISEDLANSLTKYDIFEQEKAYHITLNIGPSLSVSDYITPFPMVGIGYKSPIMTTGFFQSTSIELLAKILSVKMEEMELCPKVSAFHYFNPLSSARVFSSLGIYCSTEVSLNRFSYSDLSYGTSFALGVELGNPEGITSTFQCLLNNPYSALLESGVFKQDVEFKHGNLSLSYILGF